MPVVISSLNKKQVFENKEKINIGSRQGCDYVIDVGFDLLLTLYYSREQNKCIITNPLASDKVFLNNQQLSPKVMIENNCKLSIIGTNEFIEITVLSEDSPQRTVVMIEDEGFTEDDIKNLYGSDVSVGTKVKVEKKKADLELARVAIIKQISSSINDLKNKLSTNFKTSLFLHVALFISTLICSFAVSNYLLGLKIQQAQDILRLPTDIKILILFTIVFFGLALLLKQTVYLNLQSKTGKNNSQSSKAVETFMFIVSAIFLSAIYTINLIYYIDPEEFVLFAVLLSGFFVGIMATLAIGCGYYKSSSKELSMELDKYEYREDFENVIKNYQKWIELFINNLSKTKINNIKDRLFTLQLKSVGEAIIGILTAPFLAYGVSNTLAICFPEAAGWIRISGLRFSPVFLVLATFLIIFAFFAFVNGFFCIKKIQGSNVIKQDGFSNYMHHGVDIYGLEGIRKLNFEKTTSFVIAVSIIFIEFSMNISYFMSEIGGDLQGIFLSLIAALVPTALLIAETYMLSQTKFYIYACEELLAKLDRD